MPVFRPAKLPSSWLFLQLPPNPWSSKGSTTIFKPFKRWDYEAATYLCAFVFIVKRYLKFPSVCMDLSMNSIQKQTNKSEDGGEKEKKWGTAKILAPSGPQKNAAAWDFGFTLRVGLESNSSPFSASKWYDLWIASISSYPLAGLP